MSGRHISFEGHSLNTDSTKNCTKAHQTLFIDLGIHHENTGIQITPNHLMKGLLLFIFDLTPDGYASDGYISFHDDSNFRNELKFDEVIDEAVGIVLYHDLDASIHLDTLRKVTTDF